MRYYELTITPQNSPSPADEKAMLTTGVLSNTTNTKQKPIVFSSLKDDGSHNPNALQIEFDLPIAGFHDPIGNGNNAYIRLSGIPLELIAQARDLNNSLVEIQAGMSKGLPLVNPDQRGLIMSGQVWQCFGNWQGENTTLDIVVMPLGSTTGNYAFQWKAGVKMVDMITQTLKRNHPDYTIKATVSDNLVISNDETGMYGTIAQFASWVYQRSKSIITDLGYQGVTIIAQGKTIVIQDGSSAKKPKAIKYTDIIGQPTWIGVGIMQLKVNMRADLFMGDFINIPESAVKMTTKATMGFKKNKTTFDGNYQINQLRHLGNSRQPDANSWVTIIDCLEQ
jgi:hypothetical protein